MREGDAEFAQILNIISRGQRLVVQAKRSGADVSLAEEYITEAKYALKMNKRETAIEYSKKAIFEVVKAKREQTKKSIGSLEDLVGLTKGELRNLCVQYDIEPIGLKRELAERIWSHLQSQPGETEGGGGEKLPESEPEKESPKVEKEKGKVSGEWDPVSTLNELTPGLSYLIEEKRPDKLFRIYKTHLDSGKPGIAISRTNPKILWKKYGLAESETIWLTGKELHGDIRTVLPILEFIMSIIEEFVDANMEGMVLIDGLEYLLTNNKFNSVLRFLRQLVDNISQTECKLLVALSPDALDQTELTLLEKDLLPINYLE